MPFRNWREAIKAISELVILVTSQQKKIAVLAGISIPDETPAIVAAAMLRLALSQDLDLPIAHEASDVSLEWIEELWTGTDPPIQPETQEVAYAWIEYLFLIRRMESLQQLQLNEGDVIAMRDDLYAEVSSIGNNGRLYFKGGLGFSAWPDQVTLVARAKDNSIEASNALLKARNTASLRRPKSSWSGTRHQDLLEFQVVKSITLVEISHFEEIIDTAKDEKPIQQHLETNPHLLTALLRGGERYCLSQKRLGCEFVPDFIIGDTDSLGIYWLLVELETPRAPMYLKDGKTLGKKVRNGLDQITQWRNWLAGNISYARQPRRDNGLGLFDIREKTRSLVLVSRHSLLVQENDAARLELRQSSNIEVHTYDWLLESLRGAIGFNGPPASNPYLVSRDVPEVEVFGEHNNLIFW